jgi:O-antigen ligase
MKWIFVAALLLLTLLVWGLLHGRKQYLPPMCFLLAALPFFLNFHLYVAPISWAYWPGIVKGIEVSAVDAVALGILLATGGHVETPLPLKIFLGVYLLGWAISTATGQQVIPAVFYLWQLMRAVLVYLAVSRAVAISPKAPFALVAGLGASVLFECVVATWQFLNGMEQAGGTLGHRTMIGIMSHSAVAPAFAMVLGGRRGWLAPLVVVAGGIIAFVGASRATIVIYGVGLLITTMLSLRHKVTGRKIGIALAALAVVGLGAPVMKLAIGRRAEVALVSSNEEREALTDAARMIIADHPFGVGANQYVLVANIGGYSDRAGVSWYHESRAAPVHDMYLLVLAELGWIGFIGFVGLLMSAVLIGVKAIRRLPSNHHSELMVGAVAAIIITSLHSAVEWITMDFRMHYLLAMDIGLMTGLLALQSRRSASAFLAAKPRKQPSDQPVQPATA